MSTRCLKLDYLGIVLSITVSSISSSYFGLYNDPPLRNAYIVLSTFFASAVFWTLLGPNSDGPNAANWRFVVERFFGDVCANEMWQSWHSHWAFHHWIRPYRTQACQFRIRRPEKFPPCTYGGHNTLLPHGHGVLRHTLSRKVYSRRL